MVDTIVSLRTLTMGSTVSRCAVAQEAQFVVNFHTHSIM